MLSGIFAFLFQGLALLAMLCVVAWMCIVLKAVPFSLQRILGQAMLPFTLVVRSITPAAVPQIFHPLIAAFWLLTLRVLVMLGASAYGWMG
jgi:hypothetical protein